MLQIRRRNDIYAGLLLIGIAAALLWQGRNLYVGTIDDMGPGYFPNLLCGIQALLGLAVIGTSFFGDMEAPEPLLFRPMLVILASLSFFCVSIERLGLPLSVFGLFMIASLAQRRIRYLENLILAIVIAVFCVLVFVKGLALQMSIWPTGWI